MASAKVSCWRRKRKILKGAATLFALSNRFFSDPMVCHLSRERRRVPQIRAGAERFDRAPLAFLRRHSFALPLSALSASRTCAVARASAPALRAMASSSHGDPYTFPGFLKLHRQLVGHCFSGCFAR